MALSLRHIIFKMKNALILVTFLATTILFGQDKKTNENTMNTYKIPPQTHIGHVHLKVSDIDKALSFYHNLLGFEITQRYGKDAVFLSAGGYHHHIGLNTWQSKGAPKANPKSVGLYHTAFLYPTRKDLALVLKQLIDNKYPILGAADHGVSEAIYLEDPDGNGVELYWDKPRETWPFDKNGELQMYTQPLDLEGLLNEI